MPNHASSTVLLISLSVCTWSHSSKWTHRLFLPLSRHHERRSSWSFYLILMQSWDMIRTWTCTEAVISSVFMQLLGVAAEILTPEVYLKCKVCLRSGKKWKSSIFRAVPIVNISHEPFLQWKTSLVLLQLSGWLPREPVTIKTTTSYFSSIICSTKLEKQTLKQMVFMCICFCLISCFITGC